MTSEATSGPQYLKRKGQKRAPKGPVDVLGHTIGRGALCVYQCLPKPKIRERGQDLSEGGCELLVAIATSPFIDNLINKLMTDPYNTEPFGGPQSLAILKKMDYNRPRAMSFNIEKRRKEQEECEQMLHKWRVPPPMEIHLAVVTFFDHGKKHVDIRRTEGIQQSYELAQVFTGLWSVAGPSIRRNEMSGMIEAWGQVGDEKDIQLLINNKGWVFGRLPTYDEIATYATYFSYSPVKEYLLGLDPELSGGEELLLDLGRVALGVTDELSLQMVKKTLIGAVARALNPGCQMQTCLVLQGKQGIQKSKFFESLFGQWFGQLDTSQDRMRWAATMRTKWGVELGELEAFTTKKSSGVLKAFLSEAVDTYRGAYERMDKDRPRHTVCVGSVNVGSPLVDETGNRRFWMVSVPDLVNVGWVLENRNRLWASATALYQAGEPWWFDYEEEQVVMQRADEFRQTHPWEEVLGEVLPVLAGGEVEREELTETARNILHTFFSESEEKGYKYPFYPTTTELLKMLGVHVERQTRSDANQLGSILQSLGWKNKPGKRGGASKRAWYPKDL